MEEGRKGGREGGRKQEKKRRREGSISPQPYVIIHVAYISYIKDFPEVIRMALSLTRMAGTGYK